MNNGDDFGNLEQRFYAGLGYFMQNFAYLDLNLGLCIRFLANCNDPNLINPFLERLSTHQKLDVFRELIAYKYNKDNTEIISDFEQWFKKAIKTKCMRNTYVHGLWELVPQLTETPIRLTPTSWAADGYKYKLMSIEEFEMNATEMKDVFSGFCDLRKKYDI